MARKKESIQDDAKCGCDCEGGVDYSVDYGALEGRLIHVTVGSDARPAGPKDIEDVEKMFKAKLKGIDCRLVVTHDLVRIANVI